MLVFCGVCNVNTAALVLNAEQKCPICSACEDPVLCWLQANCLVVSDRQTAAKFVSHFREHRVGTANCKITAELSKHDRYSTTSSNPDLHACMHVMHGPINKGRLVTVAHHKLHVCSVRMLCHVLKQSTPDQCHPLMTHLGQHAYSERQCEKACG